MANLSEIGHLEVKIYTKGIQGPVGPTNIDSVDPPASSSAPGSKGDIAADSNYIYICTATNTWKRAAISTF